VQTQSIRVLKEASEPISMDFNTAQISMREWLLMMEELELFHTQKSTSIVIQDLPFNNLIVMIWDLLQLMLLDPKDAQMRWIRLISLPMERLELFHTQKLIGIASNNLTVSPLCQNPNKPKSSSPSRKTTSITMIWAPLLEMLLL